MKQKSVEELGDLCKHWFPPTGITSEFYNYDLISVTSGAQWNIHVVVFRIRTRELGLIVTIS